MKFHHPSFESVVIGIDVLNVIDAAYSAGCGNIDWTVRASRMFGNYPVRGCAIGASHHSLIQQWLGYVTSVVRHK